MTLSSFAMSLTTLALVGCGGGPVPAPDVPDAVLTSTTLSMRLTASSSDPQQAPAPPLDVTVTDPDAVRSAYLSTTSLAVVGDGEYNCPAQFFVSYDLQIDNEGASILEAKLAGSGCRWLTLSGSNKSYWATPDYLTALAADLNIPASEINSP